MPVLSIFYGIIVRMYREQGGKHNMPHIHAEYSGEEIVMTLDGTILEGGFPKNKLKLLEAWVVIHHDDLEANWKLLSNGEQWFFLETEKDILKNRREELGMTQQQVADAAHIQVRQYQRLENGERNISGASMRIGLSVCAVLKLDPYRFMPEFRWNKD